jgi:uncharacterized protein (TIGR02300 family)
MAIAAKQARGTKRTCQNNECGTRFYDLNRNPIVCPVCGGVYEIASAPLSAAAAAEEKAPRKAKKPEFASPEAASDLPAVEGEEALAEIEGEEAIGAEAEDETFLEEEEEDGGDVSGILGGPVAEGEEEV